MRGLSNTSTVLEEEDSIRCRSQRAHSGGLAYQPQPAGNSYTGRVCLQKTTSVPVLQDHISGLVPIKFPSKNKVHYCTRSSQTKIVEIVASRIYGSRVKIMCGPYYPVFYWHFYSFSPTSLSIEYIDQTFFANFVERPHSLFRRND